MKFLLSLAIASLFFVHAFGNIKPKPQCPPGYNAYSFLYQQSTNCSWQVDICYKCTITDAYPFDVYIQNTTSILNNGFCELDKAALELYIATILTEQFCTIAPCNDKINSCTKISVKSPLCWEWHSLVFESGGKRLLSQWREPCNYDAWCETIVSVCKDRLGNYQECAPTIRITKNSSACTTPLGDAPIIDPNITPDGEYITNCGRWSICK